MAQDSVYSKLQLSVRLGAPQQVEVEAGPLELDVSLLESIVDNFFLIEAIFFSKKLKQVL